MQSLQRAHVGFEGSRDSLVQATLPEVLVTSAEFGAAQGDDGVCAAYSPVHASPLQPGANRHFATRFEDTSGSTETLGAKFRVAHASAIVKDVERAFSRLGTGTGMGMERANDSLQFAISSSVQRAVAHC